MALLLFSTIPKDVMVDQMNTASFDSPKDPKKSRPNIAFKTTNCGTIETISNAIKNSIPQLFKLMT